MNKKYAYELLQAHRICYNEILQERASGFNIAAKDHVGQAYESHREEYLNGFPNLQAYRTKNVPDRLKEQISRTNWADLQIFKKDILIGCEEDKGHYIDKCFLSRWLDSCAETVQDCLESGHEPPEFILSCPTKYANTPSRIEKFLSRQRYDISLALKSRINVFFLCEHGRVSRTKYLNNSNTQHPFKYSIQLATKEASFWLSL